MMTIVMIADETQSKPEKLLYESGKKPEFLLDIAYVGRQSNMNQDCTSR